MPAERKQRYDVDLVRERTDIVALISQHVALKKRGGRYTGLCPFHQEKSPSFNVDPDKGFWHCFGCGKGGDAFKFIMDLERLTFPEAVEKLAERAGIRPSVDYEPPQRREERDLLFEVNAAAAAAFQMALKGDPGAESRAYLEGRGMSAADAERFGLGYAPGGWDSLVKHLTGRNYSTDVLVKSGLALERTRGDGYNDRFRNRLMIPIADRQGRVIAFGGRALSKEDNPKYLNTAETAIFSKSRTLYGLHLAIKSMSDKGRAIVTEGYFDTIACHLAGFTEAVATLGTALGEEHVQMLRRYVGDKGRIYLVYDGDSAGVNAALRGQALFRAAGVDVRIALLPPQHDPDTLLREGGPAALEQYLTDALSPTAFELERLLKTQPATDIEGRARLFHAAAQVLLPLPTLERMEYSAWLVERVIRAGALGDMSLLQQELLNETKALERNPRPVAPVQQQPVELPQSTPLAPQREVPLEREVMTLMVQQPDFAALVVGQFTAEVFTHPYYRAVFQQFTAMATPEQPLHASHIRSEDEAVTNTISSLAVREAIPLDNLSPQSMLDRLREAYETRRHAPPDLNDPEALRAFTARLREKSKRVAKRIIGEE